MKNLTEFKNSKVRLVFTDIDDTLTESGKLQPEAFSAMWQLDQAGIQVVPVTGRPAGWCEMIARQWPVAGVVGENGGLYFRYHQKTMKRHFAVPTPTRMDNQKRLERVRAEILAAVPGAAVASDQFCRLMDLAIDFCEDVRPLPVIEIDKIVAIFNKHGAKAKVSSIHVNGWFGDYDKLSMCQYFCEKELQMNITQHNHDCVFVGDSPNDEPMFGFFENSFGVANIKNFLPTLKSRPNFVTDEPGGLGFAAIANKILLNRSL